MTVDQELDATEVARPGISGARPQARSWLELKVRARGRSRWGAIGVPLVVLASVALPLAGYLRAPSGWTYTGVPTDVSDWAQHELWAKEMASHGRFLVNLLTPDKTSAGWFLNPLELLLGSLHAVTHIPYPVLFRLCGILMLPLLAWALVTLARRASLPRPELAALVALLAGTLVPLAVGLHKLGFPAASPEWVVYGADATPVFASIWIYLTLAALMLVALLGDDLVRGFRRAGLILLILGAIYPFFLPALWLVGGLYAAIQARSVGWRVALKALAWFGGLSLAPGIYYGIVLPRIDPEYARFDRLDHLPVPGVTTTVVSLGLGFLAILGLPRLVRGNRAQQLLGCAAVAVLISLYVPQYPFRSHLMCLSPLLVLGALAAWWPLVAKLDRKLKAIVVAAVLAATLPSVFYYERLEVRGVTNVEAPQYLTSGDVAAMNWLDARPGDNVVLARSDISPWVAVFGGKRVVVGHSLWTHDYNDRLREVNAVFDGASPRSLVQTLDVRWILIDGDRGVPTWAVGVRPVARFGETRILDARDVLTRE